jgi:hypothetical protein
MRLRTARVLATAVAFAASAAAIPAAHADDRKIDCEMTFSLKGWSAIYKTSKGEGTITCDNGEAFGVSIKITGGGLTFGKSEIKKGNGKFSEVSHVGDILGSYAQAEAHAGAVKSSTAQVLTKGEVSLALSGIGEGWDLGVDFGKFTITRK